MISNNLLTARRTPDRAELAEGDRSALATLEKWLLDPRFQKIKPQLEITKSRLSTSVRQAGAQ